ncbi:hypothetical protein NDU88_007312 [Pleurodeles waltl]|uniref:Uncharacterized protein n=1 Tax=Pleurodeles waltl TaxID=8319 RepID=A0AAV7NB52_PLEWA|nr:hypothetical protein NDU88_007312 [Pleurodeles waltl]
MSHCPRDARGSARTRTPERYLAHQSSCGTGYVACHAALPPGSRGESQVEPTKRSHPEATSSTIPASLTDYPQVRLPTTQLLPEPTIECYNRFAPLADLMTNNDDGKTMRIVETSNQVDKLGEGFVGTQLNHQLNHLRGEILTL